MSNTIKYAVYNDLYMPLTGERRKIGPLDMLKECYEPDVTVKDLSTQGFGSATLKNAALYPHSLVCLQMDSSKVAGPGLNNTPIVDAIVMGLGAWGGREISSADALLLAKAMFPAGSQQLPDGKTMTWTDPFLDANGILKRTVTIA